MVDYKAEYPGTMNTGGVPPLLRPYVSRRPPVLNCSPFSGVNYRPLLTVEKKY